MPTYEYQCEQCGHHFEQEQKMSEEPLKTCPSCNGPVKRLISGGNFILKGSGWHATDYGKSGSGVSSSKPAPACGGSPECSGCPSAK